MQVELLKDVSPSMSEIGLSPIMCLAEPLCHN